MNKGKYSITLDSENGIVRVVAHGEIAKGLGEEIVINARKTAAEKQYQILYDARQATVKLSIGDMFFLPRTLKILNDPKLLNIKAAILTSPGAFPEKDGRNFRFYETIMHNLGMNMRIFLIEKEAVEWLIEDK